MRSAILVQNLYGWLYGYAVSERTITAPSTSHFDHSLSSPAAQAAPAGAGGEGIKDVGCIQTPPPGLTYNKPSTLVI